MSDQPDTQPALPILTLAAKWKMSDENDWRFRAPYEAPSGILLQHLIQSIRKVMFQVSNLLQDFKGSTHTKQFESLEEYLGELSRYLETLKVEDVRLLDEQMATHSACWLTLSPLDGAIKLVQESQNGLSKRDLLSNTRLEVLYGLITALQQDLKHVGEVPIKPLLGWGCEVYQKDLTANDYEEHPPSEEASEGLEGSGGYSVRMTATYYNPGTKVENQNEMYLSLSEAGDTVASLGSMYVVDPQMQTQGETAVRELLSQMEKDSINKQQTDTDEVTMRNFLQNLEFGWSFVETTADPVLSFFSEPGSVASTAPPAQRPGSQGAQSFLHMGSIDEYPDSDGSDTGTVVPDNSNQPST